MTGLERTRAKRPGGHWATTVAVAMLCLCVLALPVSIGLMAVTIANFEVEAGEEEIFAYWETASEIGNLGFYIWRSQNADAGFVKLPLELPEEQFIPSEDFGIGAFYEFVDVEVTPGVTYFYKVEDVPADGSQGDLVGPESARIGPPTTTAPPDTATPIATPTQTPTLEPSATGTPYTEPDVRFWVDKSTLDAGDCATVQWQTDNVQAVFFDNTPVAGQGAQTFCPCASERHILSVTYPDGSSEDFTLELTASGVCDPPVPSRTLSPSVLATPTQAPTVLPTSTPTQLAQVAVTPTDPPRATADMGEGPGAIGSRSTSTARPSSTSIAAVTASPTREPQETSGATTGTPDFAVGDPQEDVVVEGMASDRRLPTWLLVATALLGLGFLVGGVWLWRRG